MVAAAVQFTQGATVGAAGQALFGVQGTAVVVANGNNATVVKWTFTVVDVPPGSSVPVGVVQSGGASTWTFTPDHTDSFLVMVTTQDASGATATDIRSFTVKRSSGRWIPPFSATAAMLNFAGGTRGWAPPMEDWLNYLDGLSPGGGGSFAAFKMTVLLVTKASTQSLPSGDLVPSLKVRVDTPYNSGSTVAIGRAGSTSLLLPPTGGNSIDIVNASAGVVYDLSDGLMVDWGGSSTPLLVTMSGATAGQLTVFCSFVAPES